MYERICYDNGNVKTGKKLIELHKLCECSRCKNIYYPREIRNAVVVTVAAEGINKAYDFLAKWKCEDALRVLPVQYVRF